MALLIGRCTIGPESERITIGVAIPREVAYFYDEVREGIFEAAGIFEPLEKTSGFLHAAVFWVLIVIT